MGNDKSQSRTEIEAAPTSKAGAEPKAAGTVNTKGKSKSGCQKEHKTKKHPGSSGTRIIPSTSLEMVEWCGGRLDESPPGNRKIGNHLQPGTWREYLMYHVLRIRDKRGRLCKLHLNRAQKDLDATCGKRNVVLKARQLGITTYVAARFFLNCITHQGTLSVQVAHDQRSAEEIFRIVHRLLENLPEQMRKGALVTSRANVRQIVFPVLDSEYRVETAADPNAGRGLTIHNLHCSEVARWPRDISETLASLRAAVPPDGEIFLESTPAGAGGAFYEEWQRAPETGYVRHFYPWWWDPSYRRQVEIVNFTEDERELMQKHSLDGAQIAFRREMRANFRSRAKEEFAEDSESCFLASGECVFDSDIVAQRLSRPAPIFEQADAGRLLTFAPPVGGTGSIPAKQYIVGVDPAGGGTDGDYSCVQVIEVESGLQCAELHGHFNPQDLAARVALLAQGYNNALVAVERNNHGYAVLAHLTMNQGYTNLYKSGGQTGWLTTAASRPRMLENFALVISHAPFILLSPRLLEECRTFIRHPDGTCSAAAGTHDDTVMAMAIAQVVRTELRVKPAKPIPDVHFTMLQAA